MIEVSVDYEMTERSPKIGEIAQAGLNGWLSQHTKNPGSIKKK
jgi:hypothetical protein